MYVTVFGDFRRTNTPFFTNIAHSLSLLLRLDCTLLRVVCWPQMGLTGAMKQVKTRQAAAVREPNTEIPRSTSVVKDMMPGFFGFGVRFVTTSEFCESVKKEIHSFFNAGKQSNWFVARMDVAQFMPLAKRQLQKERLRAWLSREVDGFKNELYHKDSKITEAGLWDGATKQWQKTWRVDRALFTRPLRLQMYALLEQSIAADKRWSEHTKIIMEWRTNEQETHVEPLIFMHHEDTGEFKWKTFGECGRNSEEVKRLTDEYRNQLGEADLACTWWTKKILQYYPDERITVFSVDGDQLALLVYHFWDKPPKHLIWDRAPWGHVDMVELIKLIKSKHVLVGNDPSQTSMLDFKHGASSGGGMTQRAPKPNPSATSGDVENEFELEAAELLNRVSAATSAAASPTTISMFGVSGSKPKPNPPLPPKPLPASRQTAWSKELWLAVCIIGGCDYYGKNLTTKGIGHDLIWDVAESCRHQLTDSVFSYTGFSEFIRLIWGRVMKRDAKLGPPDFKWLEDHTNKKNVSKIPPLSDDTLEPHFKQFHWNVQYWITLQAQASIDPTGDAMALEDEDFRDL